jgi:hypothetical protein
LFLCCFPFFCSLNKYLFSYINRIARAKFSLIHACNPLTGTFIPVYNLLIKYDL